MEVKAKIVFKISEAMQMDLRRKVIDDGYGMRGKSKWVSEAVERLLKMNNFVDYVYLSEDMKNLSKTETVLVSRKVKENTDSAILTIRKKHPLLEGVRSCVVRTSIMQRLLRG